MAKIGRDPNLTWYNWQNLRLRGLPAPKRPKIPPFLLTLRGKMDKIFNCFFFLFLFLRGLPSPKWPIWPRSSPYAAKLAESLSYADSFSGAPKPLTQWSPLTQYAVVTTDAVVTSHALLASI